VRHSQRRVIWEVGYGQTVAEQYAPLGSRPLLAKARLMQWVHYHPVWMIVTSSISGWFCNYSAHSDRLDQLAGLPDQLAYQPPLSHSLDGAQAVAIAPITNPAWGAAA